MSSYRLLPFGAAMVKSSFLTRKSSTLAISWPSTAACIPFICSSKSSSVVSM